MSLEEKLNFDLESTKVHIDKLKQLANERFPNANGWTLSVTYWEDSDYSIKLVHGDNGSNYRTVLFYQRHTCNNNCDYSSYIHNTMNCYVIEMQREEYEIVD